MPLIIVSTRDRSFLCTDDPDCKFRTCDPASLLRHRKRLHNYIPRPSNGRKTGQPSKAPTHRGHQASIDFSSASPSSVESSWESNSPASTSPSSYTSALSPLYFSSSGESGSTASTPETYSSLNESVSSRDSPLPRQASLLFSDSSSPCSYSYTWDTPLLTELDILAAVPEVEQCGFPYQGQHEEPQAPNDLLLPLQLPNMEQVFPGYETSGQLHGPQGLEFGLDQPHQQIPSVEVNNNPWFGLSANGSPVFQHHNLPAESFQAPAEIHCNPEICSPVRTGSLELDVEATSGSGLDIRFDSGIPWNPDYAPMTSSSCDFNPVYFDLTHSSPKLVEDLAPFTDATYAQSYQTPSASPYSKLSAFGFDYFDHSQFNYGVNLDLIHLTSSGDYFDQCRWDFGFNPACGVVQGPPGSGL